MGLFKIKATLLIFIICFTSLQGSESHRILYLMQTGHADEALEVYQRQYLQEEKHDFLLIQNFALALMEQGFQSNDPESQLLAIYGAGICVNDRALPMLESALLKPEVQHQLVALNYLARYQSDDADEAMLQSMSSPNLLIRLEAGYQLALKQHPTIAAQLESLMYKVPPPALPIFPQLFAVVGNDHAMQILRRLMIHQMEPVRIESILHAAKNNRDDLLPQIRTLATHQQPAQQEAAATALGSFKDEKSVPTLERLSQSPTDSVKLAALFALYEMGRTHPIKPIQDLAKKGDPFAITLLGNIPKSEELLVSLLQHPNFSIRTNAALALLELRDNRCLPVVKSLLIHDYRDLAAVRIRSLGNSLNAWKVIPSAKENLKTNPMAYEVRLSNREAILREAMELDQKSFLILAEEIFQSRQTELIPALCHALENMHTPETITLLKKYQQMVGAPLIRNYCNLALFRMKVEGPYFENLKEWITAQRNHELIKFRAILPRDIMMESPQYDLTPHETSRLLIESYESLAQTHTEDAINVLMQAIQYGNEKNKYTLAGLLMRVVQ